MCILGIDVTATDAGYTFQPSAGKAKSWSEFTTGVLKRKRLMPHEADKLGCRLGWAACHMFRKMGRAMLRPIFDQKSRYGMVE